MSELRKAAVLLSSLPEWQAAELLVKLESAQIVRVLDEIAALDDIPAHEQQQVVDQFNQLEVKTHEWFDFLQSVDPQDLLRFVIDEHPQTIALVLSHLPTKYGAELIAGLSTDRQLDVIRRLATIDKLNPEIVYDVELALRDRVSPLLNRQRGTTASESLDRTTELALLEVLARENPDLVRKSAA
jgi:flagellar motor switch protein FliG